MNVESANILVIGGGVLVGPTTVGLLLEPGQILILDDLSRGTLAIEALHDLRVTRSEGPPRSSHLAGSDPGNGRRDLQGDAPHHCLCSESIDGTQGVVARRHLSLLQLKRDPLLARNQLKRRDGNISIIHRVSL
jgi:hypothetical protein